MIYHMQIDNMVSLENPILFGPEEILDKDKILNEESYTPFVQMKISYSNNQSANVSRKKIDGLQVMIQKMQVAKHGLIYGKNIQWDKCSQA